MVKDRLRELQENAKYERISSNDELEFEMEPLIFLEPVEDMILNLNEIEKNMAEMQRWQKIILTEPSKEKLDRLITEYNMLLPQTQSSGVKIRNLIIEAMVNKELKTNNEHRIMKTQIATQAERVLKFWGELSTMQVKGQGQQLHNN